MTDLPDLRGWLPARVLARRLGVSPGTVRARAGRGVLEVTPNPIGYGALYREKTSIGTAAQDGGERARTSAGNGAGGRVNALGRDDGVVFALTPSSASRIAGEVGLAPSTVDRCLHRLQRAGFVRRREPRISGPNGGRPEVIWEPVES